MNNSQKSGSSNELIAERKRRILSKKTFILFALSIILITVLLMRVDLSRTMDTLLNINPFYALAACFVYFLSNLFKAMRFKVILKEFKISLGKLYIIASYHNFFNQIFPARTGELTFVYYLNKIGNANISKGLHSLLVVRIFDFIIVSIFFVCSILIFYGAKSSILMITIGALFFIASIVALFYLKWIIIFCKFLYDKLTRVTGLENKSIIQKISEKVDLMIEEFSSFDTKKYITPLVISSIFVWSALYFFFYLTITSYGVSVDFFQSVAGSTGGVLTNVLPINSFGSFGTLEAGWTGGFKMVGMNEQDAITTAFGNHLITFVASGFIAIVCAVIYKFVYYKKK